MDVMDALRVFFLLSWSRPVHADPHGWQLSAVQPESRTGTGFSFLVLNSFKALFAHNWGSSSFPNDCFRRTWPLQCWRHFVGLHYWHSKHVFKWEQWRWYISLYYDVVDIIWGHFFIPCVPISPLLGKLCLWYLKLTSPYVRIISHEDLSFC